MRGNVDRLVALATRLCFSKLEQQATDALALGWRTNGNVVDAEAFVRGLKDDCTDDLACGHSDVHLKSSDYLREVFEHRAWLFADSLDVVDEGFYIDNIAVRPSAQGKGVGRLLLELAEAEARRQGYASIYVATHELMTENRALYARIGYVEYDHRVVDGYPRVLMRKALPETTAV